MLRFTHVLKKNIENNQNNDLKKYILYMVLIFDGNSEHVAYV